MATMVKKEKFCTRNIFTTSSISTAFSNSTGEIYKCLFKHFLNESDSCVEDIELNEEAINSRCGRVVSKFNTSKGDIFIITSALEYMENDFSKEDDLEYYNTMVMFADEY